MMFDDTLISIHAPTRGATILCNHRGLVFGFQSTLPREERQCRAKSAEAASKFQSTLPREERRIRFRCCHAHLLHNFNPRSHERSDGLFKVNSVSSTFQSTLPREERQVFRRMLKKIIRFQSTLPREERHNQRGYIMIIGYFNPRSHERSDNLST